MENFNFNPNFGNDDYRSIPKLNKKQKRNFIIIFISIILFFLCATIYDIVK